MARPKRQRIAPTEQWEQLELLFTSPEQRKYEQIRPVVLFGVPPAERAREIGVPERTLYRQVQRFAAYGMRSVFATEPTPPTLRVPEHIRTAIAALKAEHPPLHDREIATICYIRFGRKLSHKTVKRVLAETPPPQAIVRRFAPFHEMDDPVRRRSTIIRLHAEGWNAKSIADYLKTSRQTVRTILKRWVEEGFGGLPDKSRAPKHPHRKVDFRAMTAIRRLGHNPGLGAWRVHAALKREDIRLSPRTCGRMLALNRALYNLPSSLPQRIWWFPIHAVSS